MLHTTVLEPKLMMSMAYPEGATLGPPLRSSLLHVKSLYPLHLRKNTPFCGQFSLSIPSQKILAYVPIYVAISACYGL